MPDQACKLVCVEKTACMLRNTFLIVSDSLITFVTMLPGAHRADRTTHRLHKEASTGHDRDSQDDEDVFHKLRTFDVDSSDAQITQAVKELRAYEDNLREQYEKVFIDLKHWINTGLSLEFERAHDVSVR